MMEVYWYFRSLAVECPISTTRETLIVLFEKNRGNYLQLPDDRLSSTSKGPKIKVNGKIEAQRQLREKTKTDVKFLKITGNKEVKLFKHFCIRFVRLNGIIFTRLGLETFANVLSSVNGSLKILLSHGPEEKLNLGKDEDENSLFILRLVAILIFTVHNIKNATSKDQSHMQRKVFLQNACSAIFLLMGTLFKRCTELRETGSSYLFPGILVFLEWLACFPEVASGSDADEEEANIRLNFWNQYVKFLNKLLFSGLLSIDAAENAFINRSNAHEEGELRMHLSLWEDFELRGYSPLQFSQKIIKYSIKAFGGDKLEERKARVESVLEASKVLAAVLKINEKEICFDAEAKKFMIGTSKKKSNSAGKKTEKDVPSRATESPKLSDDEEEEDEVIVFKPNPLRLSTMVKPSSPPEDLVQNKEYMGFTSDNASQILHPVPSNGTLEQQTSKIDDIIYLGFLEDEPVDQSAMKSYDSACPLPIHMVTQQSIHPTATEFSFSPYKNLNPIKSTMAGNACSFEYSDKMKDSISTPFEEGLMTNPARKPGRYHGPPPGFGIHPKKHVGDAICSADATGKNEMQYSDSNRM